MIPPLWFGQHITKDPATCGCSTCWAKRVIDEDGEVDTLLPVEVDG